MAVQFEPIRGLTNGHLGWFWAELKGGYPVAEDAPPIPPILDPSIAALTTIPLIAIGPPERSTRLWMISPNRDRVIQVQNGWLVANWRKVKGGEYPGFTGVRTQLLHALDQFSGFLERHQFPSMTPNLWEVTYIDHIVKGTVWNGVSDIPNVLPGLFGNPHSPAGGLEALSGSWGFRLGQPGGHLALEVQLAQRTPGPEIDLLTVRSTARGPINTSEPDGLEAGLNLGHGAAVYTFDSLISDRARRYWQGE